MYSVTYKNIRHILASFPGITRLSSPYSRLRSGHLYNTVCPTFIAIKLAKHENKIGLARPHVFLPYLDWSAADRQQTLYRII